MALMVSSRDVVVVGAGLIGASISHELARSGRSVLCLDKGGAIGAGSTSSSSAIIRFNYSTFDSVLMAWESAHRWWNLEDHLGADDPGGMVRFVPTGALALDTPGDNRTTVTALFGDIGVPYEDLEPDEIAERFPALARGSFYPPCGVDDPRFGADPTEEVAGYYTPDAGFVDDPMRAAQNFMYAAKHFGSEVRLNTTVTEIRTVPGLAPGTRAVRGVTLSTGELIDAPVVINAGGPESLAINRMAGVTNEMRIGHKPLRQEVHVLEAPSTWTPETGALVSDPGVGIYFRPGLAGTVLVGSSEPECDELQWVDDPTQFQATPTPEWFERQVLRVARRLPDLRIPLAPVGLAALYDASDDWVPLYDKTSVDGYYMACGTSGNQFKNAPMVGAYLRALIEAAEAGRDHDVEPVQVVGPHTGMSINLGAFSRRREPSNTTNSVLG